MPETALHENVFSFLSKSQLVKLKLKATRAGVWFKALHMIDRVLIDLTIKVTSTVRSVTLATNILAVVMKLEGLLEGSLKRAIREVGIPLAQKLSSIAQKWGNTSARQWASDLSFMVFLAVTHTNEPKTFRIIEYKGLIFKIISSKFSLEAMRTNYQSIFNELVEG